MNKKMGELIIVHERYRYERIIKIAFACYLIVMFIFLGFYFYKSRRYLIGFEYTTINLIPFYQIGLYVYNLFQGFYTIGSTKYLFGNILMFIPMEIFIPFMLNCRKKAFLKTIIITFCLVTLIETIQLIFTVGIFDIDDIILGTIGSMVGYYIFVLFNQCVLSSSRKPID